MKTATSLPALTPVEEYGLIYDFGMDLCQDSDFYLNKGFRVVAIDANPSACDMARKRYPTEIANDRLTVVNAAVSNSSEPLIFYVCTTLSAWSTASTALRDEKMAAGALFDEITVPSVRSCDILNEYGSAHFAKIDIEGSDLVCLEGFRSIQTKPHFISTEVDFYKLDRQLNCLSELGYRKFALLGQSGAPQQRPPRPAREGADIDYVFVHHASGLFGRELPVEWSSLQVVRAQCQAVIRQYRGSGALRRLEGVTLIQPALAALRSRCFPLANDWYDIHAAL